MNNWKAIHSKLKVMPLKARKEIFKAFKIAYPNWKKPTFAALERVVVRLERQTDVCIEYNIKKQALNRSVKYYRYYITEYKKEL